MYLHTSLVALAVIQSCSTSGDTREEDDMARNARRMDVDAAFDEIAAAHASMFRGQVVPALDRPVPQSIVDNMSNMVRTAHLDPDLQRALQVGDIGEAQKPQPESLMDSGADGNLGRAAIITDATTATATNTAGSPIEVLRAQGDTSKAKMMNVTLVGPSALQFPSGGLGAHINRQIVAVIKYGVAGSQNQVEVDWVNGTVLQVPGSFVSVAARIDCTNGSSPSGISAQVGAFISPNMKSRTSRLVRSFRVAAIPHGTVVPDNFPIPAMATEFNIQMIAGLGVAPDASPIRVALAANLATDIAYSYGLTPNDEGWHPIGGDSFNSVFIQNLDPTNDFFGGTIFFGIEL